MQYNIRHLTVRYKELYYQKAVPKKLQAAVGKAVVKQKLGLQVGASISAVAARVAEIDERYTSWFESICADNAAMLTEVEKRQAAMAFLNAHSLSVGQLAPLKSGTVSERQAHDDYVSARADEVFDRLGEMTYKLEERLPLTPEEQVIEYAWHLAKEPQLLATHALFSDAWKLYADSKQLDRNIRSHRKSIQFWERFIDVVKDQVLTAQSIYDSQRVYAEHQLSNDVQPQSIERSITPILSAFRMYAEEQQLDIQISRYKIKQKAIVVERKSIKEAELRVLWNLVTTDSSIRADVRLALLLMMQGSFINSELQRLKRTSFVSLGHPEYQGVTWLRVEDGKTLDRVRPVPLVAGLQLIRELVNQVGSESHLFGNLSQRSESSMSVQLNRVIKRVNPELTAYSLRHGWLDRCYNVDAPESFQDRVGGWTTGSKSKKRGYARLADTSLERLQQYEQWQKRVNRVLVASNEGNVVHLNQA